MKNAAIACLLILAGVSTGVGRAQGRKTIVHQPPASVCGRWVVERFLSHGMKVAPKGRLLGLKAEYTASRMQFGRLVVRHPTYRVRRWSYVKFFRECFVRLSELGIRRKSVLVVDVLDDRGRDIVAPGAELLVRNKKQILMVWDGVFYLMQRKGAPCADALPRRK